MREDEPVQVVSSSSPALTQTPEARPFFGFKIRRGGAGHNEEPQ